MAKRIAVFSLDACLPGEVRGATRYTYIATMLAEAGFQVDFITSAFQHWTKEQRDLTLFQREDGTFGSEVVEDPKLAGKAPYNIIFINEPGYAKNVGLDRIRSHKQALVNLKAYLSQVEPYDLVYCQIPPNNLSAAMAEYCNRKGIPFVVDVNDLWPEAMYMAFNVPVLSKIAFSGFTRDARTTYQLASAVVSTSQEYADRPFKDRMQDIPRVVVYVGNEISEFDQGVADHAEGIEKGEGEFWVTYAGGLSTSYDIPTLLKAAAKVRQDAEKHPERPELKVKILGDGPAREEWERLAETLDCGASFIGYLPHDVMAAWLAKSDCTINSLVKGAPQSIPTKIGDYLAAGHPMIDTSESDELRTKVKVDGIGIVVEPDDVEALATGIALLMDNPSVAARMGNRSRRVAEDQFDRPTSYRAIVGLVKDLLKK